MLTFYTTGKEKRIALMRDRFVPVILDGYLRGTGVEQEFLKTVGLVGNGFTYLTAGGRKLGGDSYLGAGGLEKALAAFDELPEDERRPRIDRPADGGDRKGVPMAPPPGSLIANVYFTYLERAPGGADSAPGEWRRALWHVEGQPGTEPGSGHGRNQYLTHIDKLWLTETEWRSLIPASPAPGMRHPIPRAIHDRIVGFYASDMAHRSTGEKVRRADLSLMVERASSEGVELRLEGVMETGDAFQPAPAGNDDAEARGRSGADLRFHGRLRYDSRDDAFDRFDIVALGEAWGGARRQAATTNFYRGGEHRRWPMGIAFQLVTTRRPVDRIPPQNANEYRCGDAYFGKAVTRKLEEERRRGSARADVSRPKHFPHRIWAACDFESPLPDYQPVEELRVGPRPSESVAGEERRRGDIAENIGEEERRRPAIDAAGRIQRSSSTGCYAWFGPAERKQIPEYPGNATALGVRHKPYRNFSALMTGINPVPGPRMGKVNSLYCRYLLRGGTEATFQHFSLSSNDNNHIRVSGLTEGRWSEVTLNFTRDARRNDGTPGVPFEEGERMDDLKVFVGKPGDGRDYELFLDDVIFFADDPNLPPDPEPFPNRVIFLAAFDTGIDPASRAKYYPGRFEIVTKDAPAGTYWGAARAVPRADEKAGVVQLQINPPKPVGARTKLRFRYHLTGTSSLQTQIFDVTDMDNRHVRLEKLEQGAWTFVHVDFTRDGKRNDGSDTPFAAGHEVDDIFFFVDPGAELYIDEVVLYDAGESKRD